MIVAYKAVTDFPLDEKPKGSFQCYCVTVNDFGRCDSLEVRRRGFVVHVLLSEKVTRNMLVWS